LEIAKTLKVSHQLVYKWKNKQVEPRKPRKPKLTKKYLKLMREWAEGKSTGVDMASSRKITRKLNFKFKNLSVSHMTVNRTLNKILTKPRKLRKVFYLNDDHLQQRKDFCEYILEEGIKGEDIFFTDESNFDLSNNINKQTNKVRLSKSSLKKLKKGNKDTIRLCVQRRKKLGARIHGGRWYVSQRGR
jgi:transposase